MKKESKQAPPKLMSHKFNNVGGDAVADDRNWISRIQNELNCTNTWQKDWGFLAAGVENLSIENATKMYTIDDKIKLVEDVRKGDIRFDKFSRNYAK